MTCLVCRSLLRRVSCEEGVKANKEKDFQILLIFLEKNMSASLNKAAKVPKHYLIECSAETQMEEYCCWFTVDFTWTHTVAVMWEAGCDCCCYCGQSYRVFYINLIPVKLQKVWLRLLGISGNILCLHSPVGLKLIHTFFLVHKIDVFT